jgi:hypothetical protein
MPEPTVRCPNCSTEIKLTESLAAPLIESTKKQFEQRLAQKDAEVARREAKLREDQAALAKAQESIDDQVATRLKAEKAALALAEAKKARDAMADEIAQVQQEKAAVVDLLNDRNVKLAEARKNELELRQERQRLQEEKERFELEKQRAIDAERAKIRESAQKEADEQSRLKLAEKEKTIGDLQAKLQDALRKAEQGSQQLQGEVLELELESLLRSKFPLDNIEPVPKGEYGGDLLHFVCGPTGKACGKILWETKRTKNWSDTWLPKLRGDLCAAKADIAILVSQALPKEVESFDQIESVWVTSPRTLLPVAIALRQTLIEVARVRQAGEGQQSKMEMIYAYLTGPLFRQRVHATLEKLDDLQEDLKAERKFLESKWAKREKQIQCAIASTLGMFGDFQGIAGKTLLEIDGVTSHMAAEPVDLKRLPDRESHHPGSDPTKVARY